MCVYIQCIIRTYIFFDLTNLPIVWGAPHCYISIRKTDISQLWSSRQDDILT